MLVHKLTGLLPSTRAIQRVRAASLSTRTTRACASATSNSNEVQKSPSRRRRFTTVSVHASAPARPCPSDGSPSGRSSCNTASASSSSPSTYLAPKRSTPNRQKATLHTPECTWSNKNGPRDKACPGCAEEVQDAPQGKPYELSAREALWQQRTEALRKAIQQDPYDALFGYSERMLSGKGLPLGWWNLDETAQAQVVDSVKAASDREHKTGKRQRKDSGVEILEASYKWSSSGYDSRTGQSWQKRQELVYDPVEGKMVPVKDSEGQAQVLSSAIPQTQSSKSKAYDDFEQLQHQKEAESYLDESLSAHASVSSKAQKPTNQTKEAKISKTKAALEKSWAADKQSRSSSISTAKSSAESPMLDTQQREWERELANAEHAAAVKQTEKQSRQNPLPTPHNWKDFKAGKEIRHFGKTGPILQAFRSEHGANLACLSILRKDKPLKHMTVSEFGQHRAAILEAFAKRAERAGEVNEATPADVKLRDEVEEQKAAMKAWESRSRKRQSATKAMRQARDISQTHGEGDMDSRVVDYCDDAAAGWYKKPALHAAQDAAQDKLAAAALVDEMRHIYETAYGAIDVSHRQPGVQLDKSLDEFDARPSPEVVDAALREFEAMTPREELESALNEYEQRHDASAVDDALKVYESEPREGLDAALRQFEKHAPPSQSYSTPPAPEIQISSRSSADIADETASCSPISSWKPKVVQRLQPALDRMALKTPTPRSTETDKGMEGNIVEDEFSYPGESEKFAYNGALESCRESQTEGRDKSLPLVGESPERFDKQARKKREAKLSRSSKPWGVNPSRRARNVDRPGVNPIDGTTAFSDAELMTQTGNFASPTGFVNHDVPLEQSYSPESSSQPRQAARKVQRTEEVFSGTHGLQKESIPQIVEHFRKLGLGPELEAYARSSGLFDPESKESPRSDSSNGSGRSTSSRGNEGSNHESNQNDGRRRGGRVAKAVLLTIPSVLAAVYATGVVVEYFRDEEASRRAWPSDGATQDGQERGWHSVRVGPALRRRREAAAAAAQAKQDEDEAMARLAWERERYYAERNRRDEDLKQLGKVMGAFGAVAAAFVLVAGWIGGQ